MLPFPGRLRLCPAGMLLSFGKGAGGGGGGGVGGEG